MAPPLAKICFHSIKRRDGVKLVYWMWPVWSVSPSHLQSLPPSLRLRIPFRRLAGQEALVPEWLHRRTEKLQCISIGRSHVKVIDPPVHRLGHVAGCDGGHHGMSLTTIPPKPMTEIISSARPYRRCGTSPTGAFPDCSNSLATQVRWIHERKQAGGRKTLHKVSAPHWIAPEFGLSWFVMPPVAPSSVHARLYATRDAVTVPHNGQHRRPLYSVRYRFQSCAAVAGHR